MCANTHSSRCIVLSMTLDACEQIKMINDKFSGLSSPANNSLQQSLYIAAIDRYLGIRGLISPITDEDAGLDYDFFHPDTGRVIKILQSIDQDTIMRYEKGRRENAIFIVDALALEHVECDECTRLHPDVESEELSALALALNAYLYVEDELFEFAALEREWDLVLPVERMKCIDILGGMEDE